MHEHFYFKETTKSRTDINVDFMTKEITSIPCTQYENED